MMNKNFQHTTYLEQLRRQHNKNKTITDSHQNLFNEQNFGNRVSTSSDALPYQTTIAGPSNNANNYKPEQNAGSNRCIPDMYHSYENQLIGSRLPEHEPYRRGNVTTEQSAIHYGMENRDIPISAPNLCSTTNIHCDIEFGERNQIDILAQPIERYLHAASPPGEGQLPNAYCNNPHANDDINTTYCVIDDQPSPDQPTPLLVTDDEMSSSGRPGTGQSIVVSHLSCNSNQRQSNCTTLLRQQCEDFDISSFMENILSGNNHTNTINTSLIAKHCRETHWTGPREASEKWKCFIDNCPKTFGSETDLWRHVRPGHLGCYPAILQCFMCNKKKFLTRNELGRTHANNCWAKEFKRQFPSEQEIPDVPDGNYLVMDIHYEFFFCTFEGCSDMHENIDDFKKHIFSKHDNINKGVTEKECPKCGLHLVYSRSLKIKDHIENCGQ
ncbi:hypothetical protein BDA99DRAFT_593587 [Phascolomyces articulosus]|uniref:C2H2-type domain-containing protein n=1 Tax=Phascolomyces articulosus TaxID=60185 RepID=A0AAD5JWT2_9FUNG|nr:hypothetical protein BDA99DRAFT_593587 [Phascolomyces articulosus]